MRLTVPPMVFQAGPGLWLNRSLSEVDGDPADDSLASVEDDADSGFFVSCDAAATTEGDNNELVIRPPRRTERILL